ncbi:uncharacterized protein NECHADRAFT_102054 [Fusarium vanettenii 77-13-4]|uniref:Expressed protein n=1 Tax=Fusarium vanettenii (strain ATCC MYA-4622 / CBS 123669 / FGSC 9596 / NRRL 45880 / 77-13-4) TaxID=660122 RepID=C7ZI05_FUSV7|nr:uncharacterized protein NECHADRAFT_102054 [Fusarium vanettenii 77-13-4]EEU36372.1 expressed protein [Fusarium vanettenii 77-13-4]
MSSVKIIITPPTPLEAEDPFRRRPPVTPLPDVPEKLPLDSDDDAEKTDNGRPAIDPTEKEVYVTRPDVEESEKEVYEPRTTILYADASEKEVYHPTQSQEIVVDEKEVYDPQEAAHQASIDASEKEVYHFETESHRVDTGKEVYDGSAQMQMVIHPGKDAYSPEPTQAPSKSSQTQPNSSSPQSKYYSPQSEYSQSQLSYSQPSSPAYTQPTESSSSTPEPEEPQTQPGPKGRFKKLHQTVVNKHKKAWETLADQSNAIINEQKAWIEKTQTDVTNSIVMGATTRYARLEKGTTTRYARLEKGTTNRYNRVEQNINDRMVRAGQCVNNYAKIKDSIPGLKQKPQVSPEAEKPK